jgi:hypothetical protein
LRFDCKPESKILVGILMSVEELCIERGLSKIITKALPLLSSVAFKELAYPSTEDEIPCKAQPHLSTACVKHHMASGMARSQQALDL